MTSNIVEAWQLMSWENYRDVVRLGRKKRLPEAQRLKLWEIFSKVRESLLAKELITESSLFGVLAKKLKETKGGPFEFVVVDEAQDVGVAQLRFLEALTCGKPNSLFFAGDLGQRIFQTPFSWKSLGVDIRGRSKTLRINYRTSHQIRMKADSLLENQISDVDGNVEKRNRTISVFNGAPPSIKTFESIEKESAFVGKWIEAQRTTGILPHEIGIFVRSETELPRAKTALETGGIPFKVLDEHVETNQDHVSISTMHLAKGLEFRAVVVMACDDQVIPSQQRMEAVTDESELEDVYNTERQLLYVACTRARDRLLLTSTKPSSEFLDDLSE